VRKAAACLLVTIAASCSRSDLELETVANEANPEAGAETGPTPMGACPAPTHMRQPTPCIEWRVTGSDAVVSGPPVPGGGVYLTSLVPSGDGALISWFTISEASTASWDTLALNPDGTPRSAIVPHLSFPSMGGVYVGVMSLAVTPQCAFGGLVDDVASGCRFLPLDGDGNEIGPVVSLPDGTSGGCGDLGPSPLGFSYIHEESANSGPLDLATIGTDGSFGERAGLGAIPGFGSRLVLHDETFLLASFFENDGGGDLTYEVEHYDAEGAQLAPATTLAQNGGSILLMAETEGGVLTSYLGDDPAAHAGEAMYVVPLASSGAPYAPVMALDVTGTGGPIYGFSLDPSPSGEALLTWNVLDETTNRYQLFVMELQPDGNPRGGPTALGIYAGVSDVHILVGADGERALLVYSGAPMGGMGGVHALPLACATH
jgi:hypothetical protein